MAVLRRFSLLGLFTLISVHAALVAVNAQSLTGRLTGTVTDAQGAVLPGADVTMTNRESKDVQRTVTNAEGVFVFAAVSAGTYSVKVELQGFSPWEATDLEMRLGERRTLTTIRLQVGGVSEVISVQARPEIAPVESGEKSARLTSEQIQNVPMVGRSAAELLKLLPGMTPISGDTSNNPGFNGEIIGINGNGDGGKQSALGNFSGNGTRADALDIVIDGAHAADPGCNCATSVNPNPDMVGEFRVLQSNYGAEHAKGPVTIDVISKAGGRNFHGMGYLYLRDYRMNSNEWRLNKFSTEPGAENKPKNQFAYPGFNLGGPLLIPGTDFNRDRNKVFFFTGYEFYKQQLDTGILQSWVPTEAMINGDFSDIGSFASLGNTYVRTAPNNLVNGRVPSNLIDRNGQVMLGLLPRPNADPALTGGYNYTESVEMDQNMHQWLSRVDVNVSDNTKLFARYNLQAETQRFPVGLWWRNGNQVPYPTSVVAPNRSHSGTASLTHIFGPSLTSESTFGVTYIDFPNQFDDPSRVSRSALGYTNSGIYKSGLDQIPSMTAWGNGPTLFNPGGFDPILFARKWLISGSQAMTKVAGEHTLKAGAYYEWVNNSQPGNGDSNGRLVPGSGAVGSSGNYFADILTGTLAEYGEQSPNIVRDMAYNIFEVYVQDSWKTTNRLTFEGGLRISHLGGWYERNGVGMAVFDQARYDPNAPASEFPGVTWTARDGSIPTSGVEVKSILFAPRVGFAYDIRGTGRTLLRGGYGLFNFHDAQGPYSGFIDLPYGVTFTNTTNTRLSQVPNVNPNQQPGLSGALDITDDRQPRTQSWSLTVQQRLPYEMTLEMGYVGSKSDRLLNSGLNNINTVPFGAMLATPDADPNQFRPLRQYGDLPVSRHRHYQNYNAFQSLLSRASSRFAYTVSYTWSKALGIRGDAQGRVTQPPGDIRDFAYGILGYDRAHVLNVGYSYLLPDLEGSALKKAALNGWQITGVSTYISGAPLQPLANTVGSNFGVTGTLPGGSAITSARITGSNAINVQPVLTCDPREGVTGDQILNPSCFTLPTPGTNGAYIFPNLRGPSYINHDFALFKNFSFANDRKFQFRASLTNVFNHPQRFLDENLNLRLDYTNGVLSNPTFGILPRDNKYGRRIVQLAFKYYF
jgi:Carboxypeptidase regulatory-like domain